MIAEDYYYKGDSCGIIKTDSATSHNYIDIKDSQTHVRWIGTRKEIDLMNKRFLSEYKHLYLDEVYPYDVPKKGTYWYKHHSWGTAKEYKETMEKTSLKLKEYKNKYKQEGSFSVCSCCC